MIADPKEQEVKAMIEKAESSEEEAQNAEDKKKKKKKKKKNKTGNGQGENAIEVDQDAGGEQKLGDNKAEPKTISDVIEEKKLEDTAEAGAEDADKKKKKKKSMIQ